MSIYKDCDIRGIYPSEINEAEAERIGRALGTLHPGVRMAVGGDVRLSTPGLKSAFVEGLRDSGAVVTDIGTIPTPALYFALKHWPLDGGATVTASHNPPQYNGIKFMFGDLPVKRADMDAVQAVAASGRFAMADGSVEALDVMPAYLDALIRRFPAKRRLRIVVDAGNGAMGRAAPEALRRCGYEPIELFCEPDGRFPNRDPNPADYSHLDAVRRRVSAEGADFGVAFDGDGDRAVFIDETGSAVMNEKTLVLFIHKLLRNRPTAVVYDQKASSVIRRAALAMGGTPIPERSGHAFIKRRFLQAGAAIAGEVSGHFFFGELGYDDGLYAALMMAELLAEADRPLSALAGEIICPPITPDMRVYCPYDKQQLWLDRIEALADANPNCTVTHLDGVRLEFSDGWLLARKSVTAEQVTLRAEADSPERLEALLKMVYRAIPEAETALQHRM